MCVCVCMYVYMCVCVCVCVDRSQEFFLLSLLRLSCSVFLRVNKRPGYSVRFFSEIFFIQRVYLSLLSLSSSCELGSRPYPKVKFV